MPYIDVCALESIAPAGSLAVRVAGRDVALFRVGDAVHAIENTCRHAGAALAGGKRCGHIVACPAHGWKYDVTTGAHCVAPALSVEKFPVEIVDGRVRVETGNTARESN